MATMMVMGIANEETTAGSTQVLLLGFPLGHLVAHWTIWATFGLSQLL